MRLSVSVSLVAMAMLTYSKVEAFEYTAIKIRCHISSDPSLYNERECLSATRTTDADFGRGGHIVCVSPTDPTKLRNFSCGSYYSSVAGQTYAQWTTLDFSCDIGQYNNGGSCSNCPMRSDGATSDEGAVSANECYIAKDVEQSDSTGTFVFENSCYYEGATSSPLEDSSPGATWSETESTTTTT